MSLDDARRRLQARQDAVVLDLVGGGPTSELDGPARDRARDVLTQKRAWVSTRREAACTGPGPTGWRALRDWLAAKLRVPF